MKLVTFEIITELLPIEGADKIELARIQGWQSVVKKHTYKVGDQVIFVPIDTVIQPKEWNTFLWDKNEPTKPIRVRTVKLRGTVSQGIIFPTSIAKNLNVDSEELARELGISKYERPIPAHLAGQVRGDFLSQFASKTDEDNLKSNILVLEELKFASKVVATMKLDGSSGTYIKDPSGELRVCSRNLELKETESNAFWQIAKKYNIESLLQPGECVQGELCGPGVQGNPMGLSELSFFVFNFKKTDKVTYESILPDTFLQVPVVKVWSKEDFQLETIETLQTFANTLIYPKSQKPAEGIVLRGYNKEGELMCSPTLRKMLSVKIINQNFKEDN